jgi:NAD dependent epimerase/dehydratase family enzyme
MSCIEIADLAAMAMTCLHDESRSGPVNAVMPEPVTNAEFTRAVARSVHRPALFPVPAFALRLALGDLSHLLLDSQRVVPRVMQKMGFDWKRRCLDESGT